MRNALEVIHCNCSNIGLSFSTVNSPSHGRVGLRRSGDIEGVRQSHGNWQGRTSPSQGDLLAWSRRVVVLPTDPAVLQSSEWKRLALSEMELARYKREKKRRPEPFLTANSSKSGCTGRKRQSRGYRTRAAHELNNHRGPYNGSDFEVSVLLVPFLGRYHFHNLLFLCSIRIMLISVRLTVLVVARSKRGGQVVTVIRKPVDLFCTVIFGVRVS